VNTTRRRGTGAFLASAFVVLLSCDRSPTEAPPSPPSASPAPTPAADPDAEPGSQAIGQDPLVTWSPQPMPVGDRSEGWLRETLAVTTAEGGRLHVTPVSTSMTLEFVDGARSLAIWLEIENVGDDAWSGSLGAAATLTDEFGTTFSPIATPTPADLHPNPDRYGYSNRNLVPPITIPTGQTVGGAIVFRPTGGNRPLRLQLTLDGERRTSWVVNLGQL